MAKISSDLISVISEMLDKAESFKNEQVWCMRVGTHANGEPITMIIAMGEGAKALHKALSTVSKMDPRSER